MKRRLVNILVMVFILAVGMAVAVEPVLAQKNSADFYIKQGMDHADKWQYDQAIADFNKALEINPRYAEAYYGRSLAHGSKGEFEKAWEDVRQAQRLGYKVDPDILRTMRKASRLERQ
jgi:Tfp pilus assembly protein PilF